MLEKIPATVLAKAAQIKLAIFDVDGVLTDGRLYLDDQGVGHKAFHVHDGQGMKMLMQTGVQIAVISSGYATAVNHRMANLGVTDVYQGQKDKRKAFEELLRKYQLRDDQIAYVGDDLPDIPLIRRAGLGVTVPNAVPMMREYAVWVTQIGGGLGAVREVCELIMQSQQTYNQALQAYLE
jgi:3-deoxy-D-manno-octulosonate 8-phosphate phosphatase (KDO 8-P phosphatase)